MNGGYDPNNYIVGFRPNDRGMVGDESAFEVLFDEIQYEANRIVRRKAMSVPKSSKHPEGITYRFHYGTLDGDTLLRYDNSHGVHEKHAGENVEEIDYPGIAELHRRFSREVEKK